MVEVIVHAQRPLQPVAVVGSKAITKVVKVIFINGKVSCSLDCTQQGLSDVAIVTGPVATAFEVCSIVGNPWTESAKRAKSQFSTNYIPSVQA